jgi:hypothetical protein
LGSSHFRPASGHLIKIKPRSPSVAPSYRAGFQQADYDRLRLRGALLTSKRLQRRKHPRWEFLGRHRSSRSHQAQQKPI